MKVEYIKFYHPIWKRTVVYARNPETKRFLYMVRAFKLVEYTIYFEYISSKPRWSRHIEARTEIWLDDHEEPEDYWKLADRFSWEAVEEKYPNLAPFLDEEKDGFEVTDEKPSVVLDLEEVKKVKVTLLDKRRYKTYEHELTFEKDC